MHVKLAYDLTHPKGKAGATEELRADDALPPVTTQEKMPGPTQTPLQTGLKHVVGCDFEQATNRLHFVEFAAGKLSSVGVPPAASAYSFGTGYNQPEDVRLSVFGVYAYVTERTGDLLRVSILGPNRREAHVVTTGLNTPQQLFLDEAHGVAYTVEYASPGSLVRIDLETGAKTVVAAALDHPIGLVLTSDLQFAYVSEQTTGLDKGRISRIQLSTAGRTTLTTGLTNPFFLTWADTAEDSLYVPQRDPANSVVRVGVTSGAVNTFLTGAPFRPSCVAAPYPGLLFVCSDSVVGSVNTAVVAPTDLLMGIGQIPISSIDPTNGRASTPPGSIYYVSNAPFGGTLPVMVNYELAAARGAAYYQVLADGVGQTDNWNVYVWNGFAFVQQTVAAETVGTAKGCFPVHTVAELSNHQPPNLGYQLDSTALGSGGQHNIQLQFLDSSGAAMFVSSQISILVDNVPCVATLEPPTLLPATTANACGLLNYGSTSSTVSISCTVYQPYANATYSTSLTRGFTPLGSPPPPTLPSGGLMVELSPITATVAQLMGTCSTAAFAFEVYVAATMTNGLWRQSQYDAEALVGFVLAP